MTAFLYPRYSRGATLGYKGDNMSVQTDPIIWANNVNTTMQLDKDGIAQNQTYYDGDNGFIVGPTDQKITIESIVAKGMFRPHEEFKFNAPCLPAEFVWSGGAGYVIEDSYLKISATNGETGRITAPVIPLPFVAGQIMQVYWLTTPNGNLQVEFGLRQDSGNLIRIIRNDGEAAGSYYGEVIVNGVSVRSQPFCPGDSVRRRFVLETTVSRVNFYSTDDHGNLQLGGTCLFTPNSGIMGRAYVQLMADYPRQLWVDDVYLVRIK